MSQQLFSSKKFRGGLSSEALLKRLVDKHIFDQFELMKVRSRDLIDKTNREKSSSRNGKFFNCTGTGQVVTPLL